MCLEQLLNTDGRDRYGCQGLLLNSLPLSYEDPECMVNQVAGHRESLITLIMYHPLPIEVRANLLSKQLE